MANGDPMGLASAFGAGAGAQSLEDIVRMRLLREAEQRARDQQVLDAHQARQALLQRQAESAQQESQFSRDFGLRQAAQPSEIRSREAAADLNVAGAERTRGLTAEDALVQETRQQMLADPESAGEARRVIAGLSSVRPATPEEAHSRALELAQTPRTSVSLGGRVGGGPGASELTPGQELSAINTLSGRYQTNTRAHQTILSQFDLMQSAMNRITSGQARDFNAAGQGVLVTFQKILDPQSVVRESEYARSADGQSLLARLEGQFDHLSRGGPGMTPESLQEFVDTARDFTVRADAALTSERDRIGAIADRYNLPRELILGADPRTLASAADTAPAADTAQQGDFAVGDLVQLENGQVVRITQLYDNGEFDWEPAEAP